METLPTRWFTMSSSELKALLFSAGVILLSVMLFETWEKSMHREKFEVHDNPEALPVPTRIDINTAPEHELVFLPGIGQARAKDIVRYRRENGPFESVEQLKEIRGIGQSTLEDILPLAACSIPDE